jgi:hypothetical protein
MAPASPATSLALQSWVETSLLGAPKIRYARAGGALFLTLIVVGLVGLFVMAVPAFGHHGHAHTAHGARAVLGRGGSTPRLSLGRVGGNRTAIMANTAGKAASVASAGREVFRASAIPTHILRYLPSPRAICSVSALYGAFGNALVHAMHLRFSSAALMASVPALLVERFVVRPVWNLLFRFQGQPSSPFEALLLSDAQAMVPFRNGRGIVSVVRDGRLVQLVATLRQDQAALPVKVGDPLRIEDVDARRERVTVSVVTFTQRS